MSFMEVIDPFAELPESKLREVVEHCIEMGAHLDRLSRWR